MKWTIRDHYGAFRAALLAYRAFLKLGRCGVSYSAITYRGIPHTTLLLGRGRDAWKVANYATDYLCVEGDRR